MKQNRYMTWLLTIPCLLAGMLAYAWYLEPKGFLAIGAGALIGFACAVAARIERILQAVDMAFDKERCNKRGG